MADDSSLKNKVVVVTGASSGIGRATALAFAKQGAKVVVAARRKKELEEVALAIQKLKTDALVVPTDVTDESLVHRLADETDKVFNGLDVWVNNAAVTVMGKFEDIPSHVARRVIEVNVFGYMYGCYAALRYFRKQNKGIIINVSSIAGAVGQAYAAPYTASKFAVKGLTEALRGELRETGIQVCTVLPATIDTPFFQHGANYYDREIKPMKPVYEAKQVASAIVDLAKHPKREVKIGNVAQLLSKSHAISPDLSEKMLAKNVERDHFGKNPPKRHEGNLFQPIEDEYDISGNWKGRA